MLESIFLYVCDSTLAVAQNCFHFPSAWRGLAQEAAKIHLLRKKQSWEEITECLQEMAFEGFHATVDVDGSEWRRKGTSRGKSFQLQRRVLGQRAKRIFHFLL
jgi:hypothetical protein